MKSVCYSCALPPASQTMALFPKSGQWQVKRWPKVLWTSDMKKLHVNWRWLIWIFSNRYAQMSWLLVHGTKDRNMKWLQMWLNSLKGKRTKSNFSNIQLWLYLEFPVKNQYITPFHFASFLLKFCKGSEQCHFYHCFSSTVMWVKFLRTKKVLFEFQTICMRYLIELRKTKNLVTW